MTFTPVSPVSAIPGVTECPQALLWWEWLSCVQCTGCSQAWDNMGTGYRVVNNGVMLQ